MANPSACLPLLRGLVNESPLVLKLNLRINHLFISNIRPEGGGGLASPQDEISTQHPEQGALKMISDLFRKKKSTPECGVCCASADIHPIPYSADSDDASEFFAVT